MASGRPGQAETDILRDRLEKLQGENRPLRARLLKLHPRRRPQYLPWQRLAALWHAAQYGLSVKAAARTFVVTRQTVANWHRDARKGLIRNRSSRVVQITNFSRFCPSVTLWSPQLSKGRISSMATK